MAGPAAVPDSFNGSFAEIDEWLAEGRNCDRNEIAYLFFLVLWLFESEFLQLEKMQLLYANPRKLNVTSKHHLCGREGQSP